MKGRTGRQTERQRWQWCHANDRAHVGMQNFTFQLLKLLGIFTTPDWVRKRATRSRKFFSAELTIIPATRESPDRRTTIRRRARRTCYDWRSAESRRQWRSSEDCDQSRLMWMQSQIPPYHSSPPDVTPLPINSTHVSATLKGTGTTVTTGQERPQMSSQSINQSISNFLEWPE